MSTRAGYRLRATGRRTTIGRGPRSRSALHTGFTLVELLVAVTLVVLIMTMFAQVFRTASNLISRQKGMAENGQRARTLTTIIQNDIQRRTFRHIEPWEPTETAPYADIDNRQGYFYYSENTIGNDVDNEFCAVDDVLQFTIRVDESERPLFGKTTFKGTPDQIDQPEGDDGQVYLDPMNMNAPTLDDGVDQHPNGLGASRFAEVSYFVRNAVLYRRVMLIRQPYDASAPGPPTDIDGSGPYPGATSFWNDFDYSAYYNGLGPAFNDYVQSLDNTAGIAAATPTLGAPFHRFGHYHLVSGARAGNPREYGDPDGGSNFIGRFTHQETSYPLFGYPGLLNDLDGDMTGDDPANPQLLLGVVNGVVNVPTNAMIGDGDDEPLDGARVAEDILLSNVQAFDVKLWDTGDPNAVMDPMPGQFVDVGHGLSKGIFRKTKDQHTMPPTGAPLMAGYGPRTNQVDNRVFDTWHPQLDLDGDGNNDYAPYAVFNPDAPNGRDGQPGAAGVDDENNGTIDDIANEQGFPGTDDNRLRAIQITIRFFDVSSNQMKQVTLMESLTN